MLAKVFCILMMSVSLQVNVVRSGDPTKGPHIIRKKEDEPRVIKNIVSDIGSIIAQMDAGVLKFWEVKEDEWNPIPKPAFQSIKSYVIQEWRSKSEAENWRTWFWIGNKASLVTATKTAALAVQLDYGSGSLHKIRREVDGYESLAFKFLFKDHRGGKFEPKKVGSESSAIATPSSRKRLFVIEGKGAPSLKELVVSSTIFEEEDTKICAILIAEQVYIRCGRDAPEWARRGADVLAKIMLKRRGLGPWDAIILRTDLCESDLPYRNRLDTQAFFDEIPDSETVDEDQIMEDLHEFSQEELRKILHQNIVWTQGHEIFDPEVIKIYEERPGTVSEKPILFNSETELLHLNECCIIDNHKVIGLFVWMGEESKLYVRVEAARKAEINLREKGYNIETPIVFIGDEDVPPMLLGRSSNGSKSTM